MIGRAAHYYVSVTVALIALSMPQAGDAAELVSIDKALKVIYKQATTFEKKIIDLSAEQMRAIEASADIIFDVSHTPQIIMYVAKEHERIVGYAFEDTVIGKWGPIHYVVGLDAQGVVVQAVVLDYQEIRGKPVAKKRFLKQYIGKTISNPIQLRKDIDGVTGATISSRSMTDGVRKCVHFFNQYHHGVLSNS